MAANDSPTKSKDYVALYKDRRYWVFENNEEKPFEGWTGEYKILVFDRLLKNLVACANWTKDGLIEGGILWGQGGDFKDRDFKEMIQSIRAYDRHYR